MGGNGDRWARWKFGVMILSHARADRVVTYRTLRKQGYTGPIWIVVDDADPMLDEYKKRFGGMVKVFSKEEIAKRFDEGDQGRDRRAVVYARNAAFDIAEELGLEYFLELDDDYRSFDWRFDAMGRFLKPEKRVRNLDEVFEAYLEYYASVPNMLTLAMAQSGDFVGGEHSLLGRNMVGRKAMNVFFLSPKRRFYFLGRVNEDVNTYVRLGHVGGLILTVAYVFIHQNMTQKNPGGMTGLYLDGGTYEKSFFTVLYCPTAVRIGLLGHVSPRIHHTVLWRNAAPMIVREELRKWKDDGDGDAFRTATDGQSGGGE